MADNTARYLKEAATAVYRFGPEFLATYTWDTTYLRFGLVEHSERGVRRISGNVGWDRLAESEFNLLVHELEIARYRLNAKPWT